MENEIHQRESSENTESFLQENIGNFKTDAQFLFAQMLRGEKLTAKTVVQKYGIADRRLRDLEISGKCQKQWVCDERGKRKWVEYFITTPKPPTKQSVLEHFGKLQQTELF